MEAAFSHPHLHLILEPPITLTCMFLDRNRKSEKQPLGTGRTKILERLCLGTSICLAPEMVVPLRSNNEP